jgi:hypothetical protein
VPQHAQTLVSLLCCLPLAAVHPTRLEFVSISQNKLLMRVTQLHALEALLVHLAACCPAATQHLHDMSCPLMLAAPRPRRVAPTAAPAASKAEPLGVR